MQDWAQTMRSRHFPAERNVVPAHITLFHALPADNLDVICSFLTSPRRAPFVRIEAPFLLGRGVAYRVVSPEMQEMRATLAARISQERFTAQDRAPWRPHLTIQNKVSPQQARELLESLSRGHKDRQTSAAALRLWRYLGGPWELLSRSPFTYTD
ncbi:2'-5' RNA ligase family protein [Gluconobacter cerinus]|uniref:2'-5' RNA ligase family protein n=1 Tax=Gluconobacter cerinus TaxID=38307 RepID=UPI001BBC7491|nr:2'-5' RNA ligase family protein [Gluconobacter cerinus]